ncbi:MAG: TIGR01244 family sulfur transferase [Pseudomonadales bacterium]
MEIKKISPFLHVSSQLSVEDIGIAAAQGIKSIINNRPDGEAEDQPASSDLKAAAQRHSLGYQHIPVISGKLSDENVAQFTAAMAALQGPVLAFCRTGTRSTTLWALSEAPRLDVDAILSTAHGIGYDLKELRPRLEKAAAQSGPKSSSVASEGAPAHTYDVLIVGGGAAGIASAASLLKRRRDLDIAVIEPREQHYYQPGWTLVGGGVFNRAQTEKRMSDVMPAEVQWIRSAAAEFEPEHNRVVLEDGGRISYRLLVVAPGIKLHWQGIEGLQETLGKNGVTSNYLFDMAPYTWELVQNLRVGRAVFTQPPMPIKCAGAPQKAMYLSCDHWLRNNRLANIDVEFCNAGAVLFGVNDYVPALMQYVEKYAAALKFTHNLAAIDGPARKAWFDVTEEDGASKRVEVEFDMIHVCPPQTAPDFVRNSPLADAAGWIEVSPETLQHPRFGNVFGLGDACSAPNAKTAAAVRKQAPVVAENVIDALDGHAPRAVYDGYGSCPLTVERGKIVMAEFGYGGKLLPPFPTWIVDGTKPTRTAWFLKEKLLPPVYWNLMLKGQEWLAKPTLLPHRPTPHEAQPACRDEPEPVSSSEER